MGNKKQSGGHSISYVPNKDDIGRKRAGRPIQVRTDGFVVDINYLGRLRIAIVMDGRLHRDEKTQTLMQLDALVESLARLRHERAEQKQKTA